MLGALRGLRRRRRRRGGLRAGFGPGPPQRRAGARRNRRRDAAARSPVRACVAHGVVAPRPAGDRAVARAVSTCCISRTGCSRRSAAACERRRSTISFRCASRSGRTDEPFECTVRSTGTRRRRRTCSSATRSSPQARCASCCTFPPSACASRILRRRRSSRAEGERADLGRPYALTVATLEPRKNLETLLDAHELLDGQLALAVVGAAGWGPQPRARPAGSDPARLRRRRGARTALSRRVALRLSLAFRGLRHPGARGDGERRSGRRICAPVARRSVWRRGGTRRSRQRRGDRRSDRGSARGAATSSSARARARRALHGARDGRGAPGGVLRARLRDCDACASASTSRRSARRAPARRATCAGCCRTWSGSSTSSRSPGAERGRRPRSRATPGGIRSRCRARARGSTSCTARASARPCAVAFRSSSRPRPGRPAPPGRVQPLDAHVQPPLRAARRPSSGPSDRRVRVHEARARRPAGRRGGARPRHPERRRRAVRPATARAPTATTCSPSGRSSHARTCRGSPRRRGRAGVELRVAGARGWGDVDVTATACASSASCRTKSLRASTAARSASRTRRSTRASASPCSRRSPAARRS